MKTTTMRVHAKANPDQIVTINESDFDPKLHLVLSANPEPSAPIAPKPAPMVEPKKQARAASRKIVHRQKARRAA